MMTDDVEIKLENSFLFLCSELLINVCSNRTLKEKCLPGACICANLTAGPLDAVCIVPEQPADRC